MVKAMQAVKYGKIGVNRATKECAVTLKDRLSGKVQHGRKSGPKPYLSLDEEEPVTFLIDVCKMGQGRIKREVIDIVRSKGEEKGG